MEPNLVLEKELKPIFLEKFPSFSDNVKELIVQYGPYVLAVGAILGLLQVFRIFSYGGALLGADTFVAVNYYVSIITLVITSVLYLMAFTPLKARKQAGWNLLYYAVLVGLAGNILQLSIIGAILSGIIGFWVLFQIRDKYVA